MLLQQLLVNAPHIFTPNYEQYGERKAFFLACLVDIELDF